MAKENSVIDWEAYGTLLKAARLANGYSRGKKLTDAVEEKTGMKISERTIYALEDASRAPSADIFLALPILLGAIVVLQMFKTSSSIWKIILVMTLFGWTSVARIARGAVMEAKNLEFNTASTALGSTPIRNLFRHILPNSLAPIIVVGTTSLATYIVLEATLSFLGVGLPTTTVSWGGDISNAQSILRTDPMVLFYPSAALAITVLAFIMMGDAVKDALDPKSRTA